MCESWSSKMMTLRGQKEAPWPGSELFSIDTYPLLIYGSRKIFPNWNILSLEDFEGRMNAAIERNAFLESELDEKVGGKKMSFSKRTWPRRTWRWRCRGWKTRPGTWGLSWKSSTLKWWDASILFSVFSVLVSIGEMLLFCVFSLFILVLQSEDEEPDNDRQMEELQQDSNKKVTLHLSNLNMG